MVVGGLMTNKYIYLLILLLIIIFSFPSICFSKSKTVEGEYCDVYLGDMKNKKELDKFRKSVSRKSIIDGLKKIDESYKGIIISENCVGPIISQYLENVLVISHTEKKRKICEMVKINLDTEVVGKYISKSACIFLEQEDKKWNDDIDDVLTKRGDKINIGLIIETKIPDIDENKKELLENEEENQFFKMTEKNRDKYKYVDRRHLKTILEEQKFSSSGITDSQTLKLGKLLNLDIIVLRLIYKESQVTKVLKVDTGEVLLFKTYETNKNTEERWITVSDGSLYYDKNSIINVSNKIIKVWTKIQFSNVEKDEVIKTRKNNKQKIDGWVYLDYVLSLSEFDCVNNTIKVMKNVYYNNKGKILDETDFQNPEINQILPDSIGESLIRKVCPK